MNALPNSPDLRRLQFLGQPSREAVVPYLTMLKARRYAPKTIQATIGTLGSLGISRRLLRTISMRGSTWPTTTSPPPPSTTS
jgi:hypothetical protein